MADIEQCLTWGEIAELDLGQTRLVVLSACETGLTKLNLSGEEYIGLPSALIIAGATNAIVTLWKVNDLATAFLTIQFYYDYLGGCPPALALNRAQIWLRGLTKGQLIPWMAEKQLSLNYTQEIDLDTILYKKEESDRLFEEPFYWAGFCAIGNN